MMAPLIDAQVHCYERDHPGRPWAAVLHGPGEVTGDQMVAAMDAVGVDGAILVSPWTMYRFDPSYALATHAAHPNRFALVTPIDTAASGPAASDTAASSPAGPGPADAVIEWAAVPGAVGVRIMMVGEVGADADQPGVNAVLSAAARVGLPVNLLCWGRLEVVAELARRHPDTQLVIDHLGLRQPFEPPPLPDPWGRLPLVLDLARFPNVVVKVTGACTLSAEPFPYPDLWEPLGRLFDAFGIERCLWGTDWTRAVELLSYAQGVEPFRLTDRLTATERDQLMGLNAARVYNWSPF